jgi:AcrR family transcriptional regulator
LGGHSIVEHTKKQGMFYFKTSKNLKFEKKIKDFTDVAVKEFSRKGFYGASLDSITAWLLLSPKSIYNYFESKNDLYL